jgi:hypothetical protein
VSFKYVIEKHILLIYAIKKYIQFSHVKRYVHVIFRG